MEWCYGRRLEDEYERTTRENLRVIAAISSGGDGKAREAVETLWERAADKTIGIIDGIAERPAPRRRPSKATTRKPIR